MPIVLVGLNHRTAPVGMRERLSLTGDTLRQMLEDVCRLEGSVDPNAADDPCETGIQYTVPRTVILSTCNRLEVYAITADTLGGWDAITELLSRRHGIPLDVLSAHLYCKEGGAAIEHLMRVAAGLDSMILGETQILGQVAHALREAQAIDAAGAILTHLFTEAVRVGKRARNETAVSRHTTSISHAAALLAKANIGDLSRSEVLIVGAGTMAGLAARAMKVHGARNVTCINRTYARAESLAHQVQGRALMWDCLPDALASADLVITATGAANTFIGVDDVAPILAKRRDRSLMFIDIAVPRNVETAVGELPNVLRFDVDDLHAVLDANLAQRQAAVPEVEALVNDGLDNVTTWLHGRQIAPVIASFRRKAEALATVEMERALRRLDEPDHHTEQVIVNLTHRIVNKLLHEPTALLKAQAANGDGHTYGQAIQELFGLDIPEVATVPRDSRLAGASESAVSPSTTIQVRRSPQSWRT
ncbi:MAG: Glutamyl-tRNA reductase [Chloroflexi bacterium]|nr:Glutamyl-tRNA reductase [Chloroflexota bacterium]